jgi:hypothetical protein
MTFFLAMALFPTIQDTASSEILAAIVLILLRKRFGLHPGQLV